MKFIEEEIFSVRIGLGGQSFGEFKLLNWNLLMRIFFLTAKSLFILFTFQQRFLVKVN